MEPLSLTPREKEELSRDREGTDKNFEGDGGSSKEELEINLDIIDQIDGSVETNLLDTFLETLVGRDDAASTTTALALLEANSGIEVCQRLLKKWKHLRPLTRKFVALVAELKKNNEHLTMDGFNKAEKEVKILDEENYASEESIDTSIRLYKKAKHTHVSGEKASSTKALGIDFQVVTRVASFPIQMCFKIWKTLISDPYFNMKHQLHHVNDLNSQKLLVVVNMVAFFSSSSLSTVQLVEDVQNHDCPTNCIPDHYCNIYGSCDGLVLVGVFNRYDKQLFLWNPSTRESTALPYPEFISGSTTFGLGYDPTSDDYKILKVDGGYSDDMHKPSYEILALKSGSWRKIRNYPTKVCPRTGYTLEIYPNFDEDDSIKPLAFLHGAFHWVGFSSNSFVVSFSSSSDNKEFRVISLPEPPTYVGMEYDDGVSVLGGMLCFYCTHYKRQMEGYFKLWIMKNYGVKESWTEIFTLNETPFHSIVPKYRFADGELVLCCKLGGRSVFRTSKGPFGLWPQIDIHQDGVVYTESLISPKSLI